jgi:hypothetical protein
VRFGIILTFWVRIGSKCFVYFILFIYLFVLVVVEPVKGISGRRDASCQIKFMNNPSFTLFYLIIYINMEQAHFTIIKLNHQNAAFILYIYIYIYIYIYVN